MYITVWNGPAPVGIRCHGVDAHVRLVTNHVVPVMRTAKRRRLTALAAWREAIKTCKI